MLASCIDIASMLIVAGCEVRVARKEDAPGTG